jgi:hypothetical protein
MHAPRSLVVVPALALLGTASAACPPAEMAPCFPTTSAAPLDESEGGFSRKALEWEIDKMPALVDVPETDAPPSPVFLRAQRDMRTEFWADAAKGFLSVVRGDTHDGKKIRLYAEFNFAVSLFRLRYFDEARRVFRLIADDKHHPEQGEAEGWMSRRVCPG